MTEQRPSQPCPVCETPDGDHLDWCTPQARARGQCPVQGKHANLILRDECFVCNPDKLAVLTKKLKNLGGENWSHGIDAAKAIDALIKQRIEESLRGRS